MIRRLAPILLVLAAVGGLLLAIATGKVPLGVGAGPEKAAAREVHKELLSRLGRDGAFGYMATLPSDVWSTGEALCGLAAHGDPRDKALCARLCEYNLSRGVMRKNDTGGMTFAGYPVGTGDTLAAGESTGYAVAGIGLARARYGLPLELETRRLARFLAAKQNKDGSFSSVFDIGETAARSSAVQDCLLGLLALEAGEDKPTPEIAEAVLKAATFIGETYDQKAGGWLPRRRKAWGGGQLVPGCSEAYAWLLFECRDYLQDAGSGLPTVADNALLEFAKAFEPQPHPLDHLPATDAEDYVFDVPPGEKSSWGGSGHRWGWVVWRVLAAERLAAMPGNLRAEEWKEEATRLRNRLKEIPHVISKSFTFHVAETLLMLGLVSDAPLGSPHRASLWKRFRADRAGAPKR